MLYLITYNKDTETKELVEAIKALGNWWHYLETTWLVKTDDNANTIYKKLKLQEKGTEFILIVKIDRDMQGLLPTDAWDWIHQNYPK